MTLSAMHPTWWGLETDYLHFLAALGWLMDGGLMLFFAAPREGVPSEQNGRARSVGIAAAFLLFGGACAAGMLDDYGHPLANVERFGLVAEALAAAAVLVGLALAPVPSWMSARVPERWVRAVAIGVSIAIITLAPCEASWWMIVAAGAASLSLLFAGDGKVPRGIRRFECSIECLLGILFAAIALAWALPDAFRLASSASLDAADPVSHAIGVAQCGVLAGGAWAVFVGLWTLYLRVHAVARIRARHGLFGLRPVMLLPILEVVVLTAGFFFAQANAEKVKSFVGSRMLAEIRALAGSIDWDPPTASGNAASLTIEPATDAHVRVQLEQLLGSFAPSRAAIIWEIDEGAPQLVAAAAGDAEDRRFDSIGMLPPAGFDARAADKSQSAVFWRRGPLPHSWALAIIPAREFALDHPTWNLSLAIDARGLAEPIAARCLQSLAIIALVALLVGFGVVHSVHSLSETEMRALKEKAEAENRAKSDFLAMVSHEVRTPLQSVLGFAELAASSQLPDDAARHVRAVRSQGAVLLRIVQDILDFSALRSGQLHVVPEVVSLRELAVEVQRGLAERAAAKGLVLTVDVAADAPDWVMADRVRLSQVLLNLVGNAVKFTQRGGVRLAVAIRGRSAEAVDAEFTVSDTGAGIPPAQLRRIFEPFRKLRDDDTPFGGGVGLGLAICQQVVELLGGKIEVESIPGEGTTFRFRLALLLASGPAPAPPTAPCVLNPASPAALAGLSVLLVDDNPHVRELLREFLRRLGASVIARPDGRSALAAVRARRFDVVLLDLRLPDMDVAAVASGIRRISGAPQEPWVVGISAGVSDLEIQSALEHGLNDFMLKPVSMAGLAETIRMSPVAARIVVPVSGAVETISIEVTAEVRRAFFEETTPVLERIELFCRDNRARQAGAEAHYLANGCLMLGLDDALACCRTLERLALSDDLQAAVPVVARLRAALERAAETATTA